MSEIAPWLVLAGAALVLLTAATTLIVVMRALRRTRRRTADARPARTALEAAAGRVPEDELMPLLLGAAVEATGADAAIVSLARRSYSMNLDLREARSALDALDTDASQPHRRTFPVDRDGLSGVLALYWPGEAPSIPSADIEALLASAFRRLAPAETQPSPTVDRVRSSRLADLNGTLDTAALLEKIVAAAIAECGADAAAARITGDFAPEPVSATSRFATNEAGWVATALESRTLAPSVTRYFMPAVEGQAPITTAFVAPLRGAGHDVIGSLVAAWRRDLAEDADRAVGEIATLIEDARTSLANAMKFQQLQSTAERRAASPVVSGPMQWTIPRPGQGKEESA